jgi:hypothetical protein
MILYGHNFPKRRIYPSTRFPATYRSDPRHSRDIFTEEPFVSDFTEHQDSIELDGTATATEPQPPTAAEPNRSGNSVPRIAVVGVHGVGHHLPNTTENALANLLLSFPAREFDGPHFFKGLARF